MAAHIANVLQERRTEVLLHRREAEAIDENLAPACDLVLIEPRQLIRECLLESLTGKHDGQVSAFASIPDWQRSLNGRKYAGAVILRYGFAGERAQAIRDESTQLAALDQPVQFVVVSDTGDADEILEAVNKGVRGYITTSLSLNVVLEVVRLVKVGGTFVPPSVLRSLGESHLEDGRSGIANQFTPRQEAVLEAIRRGKANKIIAYELRMKESTVKVHVRNIMRKLGAKNRTEVAVLTFDGSAQKKWLGARA